MMKKLLKVCYSFLVTAILVTVGSVSAATCSSATTVNISLEGDLGSTISGLVNYKYTGNNGEYTAFCLDPELPGPNTGTVEYCLDQVSSLTKTLSTYEKGMVYIYQNGYPNGASYESTNTALRLWSYYNNKGRTMGSAPLGSIYAGSSSPVYLNTLDNLLANPDGYAGGNGGLTGDAGTLRAAFDLFNKAIEHSKLPNDAFWQPDLGAVLGKSDWSEINNGANGQNPWSISTTLTITGLDNIDTANGGFVKNVRLESRTSGATFTITGGDPAANIATLADENGRYTFNIVGSGTGGCSADFDVVYDYYDPRDPKHITIVTPKTNGDNSNTNSGSSNSSANNLLYQRMVIVPSSGNGGNSGGNSSGGSDGSSSTHYEYTGTPSVKASRLSVRFTCQGDSSTRCMPIFTMPFYCEADQHEGTIEDPDDWEHCLFEGEDPTGNSYQIVDDNKYCTVACREEYDFDLPGDVPGVTRAGHYFNIGKIEIGGFRECRTSDIEVDEFDADMESANRQMVDGYNQYAKNKALLEAYTEQANMTVQNTRYDAASKQNVAVTTTYTKEFIEATSYTQYDYSSNGQVSQRTVDEPRIELQTIHFTGTGHNITRREDLTKEQIEQAMNAGQEMYEGAKADIETYIGHMEGCSAWSNNFDFEPLVLYDYEEEYYMDMIGGKNYMEGTSILDKGEKVENDFSLVQDGISHTECDESGCKTVPNDVEIYSNVTKIRKDRYSYQPYTIFYTKHPTGEITTKKPEDAQNYTELGKVFPVSVLTKSGTYEYNLYFNNLGQYNDGSLGRFNELAKDWNYNTQYTCNYTVDESCYICPPIFEIEECEGSNCPPIFEFDDGETTAGGLEYFYRTVSTNDMFPNSNTTGHNNTGTASSNYSRVVGENWQTEKGKLTQEQIENSNGYVNPEPEYSFTLTPGNMQKIKEYNQARENGNISSLGYADFTLICNEETGNCRSTFLNDGEENNLFTMNERNSEWVQWTQSPITAGTGPAWK